MFPCSFVSARSVGKRFNVIHTTPHRLFFFFPRLTTVRKYSGERRFRHIKITSVRRLLYHRFSPPSFCPEIAIIIDSLTQRHRRERHCRTTTTSLLSTKNKKRKNVGRPPRFHTAYRLVTLLEFSRGTQSRQSVSKNGRVSQGDFQSLRKFR